MLNAMQRHRFTVEEWERMGAAGVLPPDARMELIEGEVIDMAPIGPAHGSYEKRLIAWFGGHIDASEAIISAQDPIRLGDFSEPQPDLMLLRPKSDFYAEGHPTASDVLLLIEVADTTLERDRDYKMPLYGRYGVVESWLLNLLDGTVEVYTNSTERGYADRHIAVAGEVLRPVLLNGLAVPVNEILPT